MSTYPCEAPLWQQIWHLKSIPLNPYFFFLFEDWAMCAYQMHAYFNFLLMALAPRYGKEEMFMICIAPGFSHLLL